MVISRDNLRGLEIDLAGAAAVIALAVAGYALLLHGPLRDVLAGSHLREQQAAAAQAITSAQAEYAGRVRELEQARAELTRRAGWIAHPDLPGEVLARINELARQCDVRISRWQPDGEVRRLAEYQEQCFSIEGAATWPALLQWFALIEQGVPLLDMTHFSVSAPIEPGRGACEFSCSLKLYRGKDAQAIQTVAARP